MLYPLAYNTGIFMLMALSYMMVGTKVLFDKVWCSSPRSKILSSHVDSETESDAGASLTSQGDDLSDNRPVDLDRVTSLIERDNETLREANEAWYERVELLEKEKRQLMNDKLEVINNCTTSLHIMSMMLLMYGAVVYTYLLRKMPV
jgi:hypothetical protein